MHDKVTLVECPRDAMQGWPVQISTADKISYINCLLKVGFHSLDCASFVSPKAIPQMADSAEVIENIEWQNSHTKLLAIVANTRGAQTATALEAITYVGYPFSISETFQQLNTNSSIPESWDRVRAIQELCTASGKQMVVYFSMGFGNPYGDVYNEDVIATWAEKMKSEGITIISLADTVGLASPAMVHRITSATIKEFGGMQIGVHLHSTTDGISEKLEAAVDAGCRRFDGALKGIGGCPMANNALVGNMDTEKIISLLESKGLSTGINPVALLEAANMAANIFNN